jgi:hypothetical protein
MAIVNVDTGTMPTWASCGSLRHAYENGGCLCEAKRLVAL